VEIHLAQALVVTAWALEVGDCQSVAVIEQPPDALILAPDHHIIEDGWSPVDILVAAPYNLPRSPSSGAELGALGLLRDCHHLLIDGVSTIHLAPHITPPFHAPTPGAAFRDAPSS
jgi:hypothetical protein